MLKIVCIGAGRLANHLMPALEQAGCHVAQIYNRSASPAHTLSAKLRSASTTNSIAAIIKDADLYFITVADDAVPAIAGQITFPENQHSVFVHCSGVLPLDALSMKRKGVFYPLQSFSPNHLVDWNSIPILITSDQFDILEKLRSLANRISNSVHEVTDADKSVLHLSAVFANNFTNHMLTLAEKICRQHHVDFSILKPLIQETFEKAIDQGPALSQTGPAIRGDQKTIEKHIKLLDGNPDLQDVYRMITDSIRKT